MFSSRIYTRNVQVVQWIPFIFSLLYQFVIVETTEPQQHENTVFSGEFEDFLNDLGSKVFIKKITKSPDEDEPVKITQTPTTTHKIYLHDDTLDKTKKAFLGRMLMMKLVSYYEDKYNLANIPTTTIEPMTVSFSDTVTNYNTLNGRFPEFHDKHLDENQVDIIQKNYDDNNIPEVVIM